MRCSGTLVAQFWGAVIFLGLAYLIAMYSPRLIGETAAMWVVGILVMLWLINLGF